MGKTALCIQMLQLLSTGRTYKISELAELLETKDRNIIEYKKELEECGYYIISNPSRNGGYRLEQSQTVPAVKLSKAEKNALQESTKYIMEKKDYIYKQDFQMAMGKIFSSINMPEDSEKLIVVDKYQLSMDEKAIQDRYLFIEQAIILKRAIEIEYNSLKHGLVKHVLHPYKLYLYNNSWFFLAWNPEVGEVWYFKVNRIEKYQLLSQKFTVWKYFKESDYLDKHGMINNGDYYHIELIASKKRAMLMKERVYGKNQVITELPDGRVNVSLDMQNKEAIISYALSCGEDIEVIEPQWLKDDLSSIAKNIIEKYKKFHN